MRTVLLSSLLILAAAVSAQRTIRVPLHFTSIQAAIDDANHGDTVLVAPGTYPGLVDFKGKAITVRSEAGRWLTTLKSTTFQDPVVTFHSGEGPGSVLEGFTITGGRQGGIECLSSSPVIRWNTIRKNYARWLIGVATFPGYVHAFGGGLYCVGSAARIEHCEIVENIASAYGSSEQSATSYGGGAYLSSCSVEFRQCLFLANRAMAGAEVTSATAYGGGLYAGGNSQVKMVNCAILKNTSMGDGGGVFSSRVPIRLVNCLAAYNYIESLYPHPQGVGGLNGVTAVNCIIRENGGTEAIGVLSYCNIKGGASGAGNFDADPGFIDGMNADFHLRPDSLCRDAGTLDPDLPDTDFDGTPRVAGKSVDVGLDEFFAQLSFTGTPSPGQTIQVRVLGEPGQRVYWAFARRTLTQPGGIPGLLGTFFLDPTALALLDLGAMPAGGQLTFAFRFESTFPRITVPMQALVGLELSNLVQVVVQ
jgi:hypothetical protein